MKTPKCDKCNKPMTRLKRPTGLSHTSDEFECKKCHGIRFMVDLAAFMADMESEKK